MGVRFMLSKRRNQKNYGYREICKKVPKLAPFELITSHDRVQSENGTPDSDPFEEICPTRLF